MARSHLRHVVTDKSGNVIENAAVFVGERPDVVTTLPVIANKSLHLDASQLALSAGAAVSSWTDLSGNGNHAVQATAGQRPVYRATGGGNDLPYVEFSRGNAGNFDQLVAPITATATRTWFFVVKKRTPAGAVTLGNVLASLGGAEKNIINTNTFFGFGYQYYQADDGIEVGVKVFGGNATQWNVIAVKFASTSSAAGYINDAFPVSFDPEASYATGTELKLGSYDVDFDGDYNVAEVILYDAALSEANISNVILHLQNKYSIVSEGLVGSLYADRDGTDTLTNPLVSNEKGEIEAWLESPQRLDLLVTDNTNAATWANTSTLLDFTDFSTNIHTEDMPQTNVNVFYARPEGNNESDGFTWNTAKKDIFGALNASTGPPTIYYQDGTYIDSTDPDQGLWMMDTEDTQWNDGEMLPGWRVQQSFRLVGVAGSQPVFGRSPRAALHGGSATDRDYPAIWFSQHTNQGITLENVQLDRVACPVRLGIDSGGTESEATAGFNFINCELACANAATAGPGIELGYVFWAKWDGCFLGGNVYGNAITAASINAGTTARFTVAEPHSLSVGDTVQVEGINLAAYNSASSTGAGVNPEKQWKVTNVSDDTHWDSNIEASPAAATITTGETMWMINSPRRQAISYRHSDFTPAVPAPGIFELSQCVFVGGFSYHIQTDSSYGSIKFREVFGEGGTGLGLVNPPLFHLRLDEGITFASPISGAISLDNVSMADGACPSGVALVDGELTDPAIVHAFNTEIRGNATQFNGVQMDVGGGGVTNWYKRNQITGTRGGLMLGRHDGARRLFGPHSAPFVNLASQNPADWGAPGGTAVLTTGIRDPSGTLYAGEIDAGAAPGTGSLVSTSSQTYAVGDWVLAGVWRRIIGGTPGADTSQASISLGASVTSWYGNNSPLLTDSKPQFVDDGWEWTATLGRITASSGAKTLTMTLGTLTDEVVEWYAPVLIYIPVAEALSDAEVMELWRSMGTWPETTPRGDIGFRRGQNLHLPYNYIDIGVISAPAAPASNYGRLYVDTSGGKDRLIVRFASGAVQILATEP